MKRKRRNFTPHLPSGAAIRRSAKTLRAYCYATDGLLPPAATRDIVDRDEDRDPRGATRHRSVLAPVGAWASIITVLKSVPRRGAASPLVTMVAIGTDPRSIIDFFRLLRTSAIHSRTSISYRCANLNSTRNDKTEYIFA